MDAPMEASAVEACATSTAATVMGFDWYSLTTASQPAAEEYELLGLKEMVSAPSAAVERIVFPGPFLNSSLVFGSHSTSPEVPCPL